MSNVFADLWGLVKKGANKAGEFAKNNPIATAAGAGAAVGGGIGWVSGNRHGKKKAAKAAKPTPKKKGKKEEDDDED